MRLGGLEDGQLGVRGLWMVAGARRKLLGAGRRVGTAAQLASSLSGARYAAGVVGRYTKDVPSLRREYVDALALCASLHLEAGHPADALAVLDTLLNGDEGRADLDEDPAERLAHAVIQRGNTLRLLARYHDAEVDLTRALRLPTSPISHLAGLNALGMVAKETGQYDRAEVLYQTALDGLRSIGGPHHPDVPYVLHNLAGLEHARGRFGEAERFACLAIAARTLPDGTVASDSVGVAADLAILGAAQIGQHRLNEAQQTVERARAIWTRRRGPDHYEVAFAEHVLGTIAATNGELGAARVHLERSLRIKRASLPGTHPEILALKADLASVVARLTHPPGHSRTSF